MGAAGAKGLRPAFSGAYVKNAGEDETIRDKNCDTRHNDVDTCHSENFQFIDIGASTRELHHRQDVTEIVVDGIYITEG
jgi:hypothetical protein